MFTIGISIYKEALIFVIGKETFMNIEGSDPRIRLSYAFFFQINAFLMSFLIILRLTGQRFKNLVYFGPVQAKMLGLTLLICFGSLLAMPLLNQMNAPLGQLFPVLLENDRITTEANNALLIQKDGVQFIFSLIVMGLLPAICEELVFRGFLIGKIREAGTSDNFAIIISAAIFALTHFQPLKFLAMFFFGICLGFVYLRFKNLKYSILLHFLINGIQITLAFLVGSGIIEMEL